MTQGQYVAAAYGVVFVVVLAYVAIISAKLARIQAQTAELLELARRRPPVEPTMPGKETAGGHSRTAGHTADAAVSRSGPSL